MSKTLYVWESYTAADGRPATRNRPASRSEIIEALAVDYEAAYRVMFPDMHLEGSETTEFDESWCRSIVDAALGLAAEKARPE